MFSGSRARAVADYWTSARTRATVGATSFLPSPRSPLSTSLSLAISRSASSRRIRQPSHFGNEGARLAICECVCFRSIPPETYLTCKGRKNGKGSERFCTVSLFYGMFPCLPLSLPPQFATPARPSLLRNNVGRFCATKPGKSNALRYGPRVEVLEQWRQENMRCEIQFFTRMRGTRNGVLTF